MAQEIKKTMEKPLAWLEGKLSDEQLAEFTEKFCYKVDGASAGPREVTILRVNMEDTSSEILGRKCMVTGKFFLIDRFAKGTSCIKEADGAKAKLYTESKKIEKEALSILEEAREISDIEEKVAKFNEYDAKLLEAAEVRKQPVEVDPTWLEGSFDTIDDLAAALA